MKKKKKLGQRMDCIGLAAVDRVEFSAEKMLSVHTRRIYECEVLESLYIKLAAFVPYT
jgi:hypothetical protein